MSDIVVSEWTPEELKERGRCYCDCHQHPGTYPTTLEMPCRVCGHVNELGYCPWGSSRFGWVEYYIFDRERVLGMNIKKMTSLLLVLVVFLVSCTAIVDNTGRTPEVASATKTAVAMLQPRHPSIEVQLFPNATDEGLLPTVTPTPAAPDTVCLDIKGNINAQGEEIYHMQGQANYHNTKIDKPGEKYFCTEEEAQEAGFRKAQR